VVIEPRFDQASFFKGGLAYVEVRGKSRYIDRHGNVVLETDFKGGFPFSEGLTVYVEERSKFKSLVSLLTRSPRR